MAVKPRSVLDILKHILIMVGIAAVFIIAFFFIYLPGTTNHGESITVPDLVGMPISEVDEFLSSRDLRFEVLEDSGFSEDYPPLTVLLQEPYSESQVKEGRKIYLTLNMENPPLVRMPDLIQSSHDNARLILRSRGLREGTFEYRPDKAEGTVLEQWYLGEKIRPGAQVPKGAAIDLIVADGFGDRDFSMPLLKGLTLSEAMVSINGSKLALGQITYLPDTAGTPGLVVDQFPIAGNGVQEGATVDLTVFEGDEDDSDPLLDSLNQTL